MTPTDEHAERDAPDQPAARGRQRPPLLGERAEVRQGRHRHRREHEDGREPGAVVDAHRVRLPVRREPRPRERPDRDPEAGATAEQQRRRALHPRRAEHEPQHHGRPRREHAAARIGQQQPDDQRVDVDHAGRAQPVPVLPPRRQPQGERHRHREQQPERVPVPDRRAQPRHAPGRAERRDRLPEQRPAERQREHTGQHVRPLPHPRAEPEPDHREREVDEPAVEVRP